VSARESGAYITPSGGGFRASRIFTEPFVLIAWIKTWRRQYAHERRELEALGDSELFAVPVVGGEG
jgi:hypothetical protein